MTDLAQALQLYGGWGVAAGAILVCRMLYKDKQAADAARIAALETAVEDGRKTTEAFNTVIDELGAIRVALERKKG